MTTPRATTVRIGGSDYRIRSDADEDHLHYLASIIDQKMQDRAHRSGRSAASTQLLVMVALELADELVSARSKQASLEQNVRHTIERAISRIDRALEDDNRRRPGENSQQG